MTKKEHLEILHREAATSDCIVCWAEAVEQCGAEIISICTTFDHDSGLGWHIFVRCEESNIKAIEQLYWKLISQKQFIKVPR